MINILTSFLKISASLSHFTIDGDDNADKGHRVSPSFATASFRTAAHTLYSSYRDAVGDKGWVRGFVRMSRTS